MNGWEFLNAHFKEIMEFATLVAVYWFIFR